MKVQKEDRLFRNPMSVRRAWCGMRSCGKKLWKEDHFCEILGRLHPSML
jgi:hypothetical protein